MASAPRIDTMLSTPTHWSAWHSIGCIIPSGQYHQPTPDTIYITVNNENGHTDSGSEPGSGSGSGPGTERWKQSLVRSSTYRVISRTMGSGSVSGTGSGTGGSGTGSDSDPDQIRAQNKGRVSYPPTPVGSIAPSIPDGYNIPV